MLGIWEYFWSWTGGGSPTANTEISQLPVQIAEQSLHATNTEISQLPVQVLEKSLPTVNMEISQLVVQVLVQKPNQPRIFITS